MRLLVWTVAWVGWPAQAWSVPWLLNFSGRLGTSQGDYTGVAEVRVTLYDDPASRDPVHVLWTEVQQVYVDGGRFHMILGLDPGNPVDVAHVASGNLWIGVQVADDEEMTPRMRVASVPFAFMAQDAETLQGQGPQAFAAADHRHALSTMAGTVAESQLPGSVVLEAEMAAALTQGLAGKADAVHGHGIGDVAGLQPALDGKAPAGHDHGGVYAPEGHDHDARYVNEGQGDSVTGRMVVDGTLGAEDLGDFGCEVGQVLKWDPLLGWGCGADQDTDTTYGAGNGLRLEAGVFSVDEAAIRGWCYDDPGELHVVLDPRYAPSVHAHDDRYYGKGEVDGMLGAYHTASQVDALLAGKADAVHGHWIGDVAGLQPASEDWARGVCYDTVSELEAALSGWDQDAADDLTTATIFAGDVQGASGDLRIAPQAVTSLAIADGSVTNADIAGETGFLSVRDHGGTEHFMVTNGAIGLQFVGAGATTVGFDAAGHRVIISSEDRDSGGTVTSVGLSMPETFSVGGSPVTGSGTIRVTWLPQQMNTVLAAPDGAGGLPVFRRLVSGDLPALDASIVGSGTLSTDRYSAYEDLLAESRIGTGPGSLATGDHQHSDLWSLGGNAGTTPGSQYLGTSDFQALELRTNGQRALRLEPETTQRSTHMDYWTAPIHLAGYRLNEVRAGAVGATIGGGGGRRFGEEMPNRVNDMFGTVAGGIANQAGDSNRSLGSSWGATVAGGQSNIARGEYSTVGGGLGNMATQPNSAICGGWLNMATNFYATVGGGGANTASGGFASVLGGRENVAGGEYSSVVGGWGSRAQGDYSLAAGRRAKANQPGCFVWGDSTDADVACDTQDRFVARASGGVHLYTNSSLSTGAYLASGSGTWTSLSDREAKTDFEPVDPEAVLDCLAAMPVTTWRYREEPSGARHMGPMAQDFHACFGLGDSDRHIATIDSDGVAFAAIQGLNRQVEELRQRVTELTRENQEFRSRLERLERTLADANGPPFPPGTGGAGRLCLRRPSGWTGGPSAPIPPDPGPAGRRRLLVETRPGPEPLRTREPRGHGVVPPPRRVLLGPVVQDPERQRGLLRRGGGDPGPGGLREDLQGHLEHHLPLPPGGVDRRMPHLEGGRPIGHPVDLRGDVHRRLPPCLRNQRLQHLPGPLTPSFRSPGDPLRHPDRREMQRVCRNARCRKRSTHAECLSADCPRPPGLPGRVPPACRKPVEETGRNSRVLATARHDRRFQKVDPGGIDSRFGPCQT
ncbi:tail fiber domain-containing protein [Myxococcota bacterium]|nr:tail fiber domain-containing protein [Myxococcota bacterium]